LSSLLQNLLGAEFRNCLISGGLRARATWHASFFPFVSFSKSDMKAKNSLVHF
jgi:hypothetical protein